MKRFTSDLHFFHKRICEFTDRHKFTTPEQHTEWLINIWNQNVAPTDEVWHLGDFSFSTKYDEVLAIVERLNGKIHMIKGNHCDNRIMRKLRDHSHIEVYEQYKEIKIGDQTAVLFHFPIASWHKQGYGSWHLHGHCHGNLKPEFSNGKMLDVGIDNAYNLYGTHRFFSELDIASYMARQELVITDHHKER